jgi:preprotein translocase subunit SecB
MAETNAPPLVINTQYIKDLSFENPHAPGIYQELAKSQPRLSVNVDVEPRPLEDGMHEVVLKLQVAAVIEDTKIFLVELDYAGLVTLKEEGANPDTVTRILFVEIPRYLFPFARAVIANITRDGGLPPLLIQPIDFQKQFRAAQGMPAQPQKAKDSEAASDNPPESAENAGAAGDTGDAGANAGEVPGNRTIN